MAMETPPANSELGLQPSTTQLATTAAWRVLGLLLSHGRPTRTSDLASSFAPDFIRFLCSIPNSPLQLVDYHFVTISQIGVAAVAQFFANFDVFPRYLDLQQSVPPLLANVRLSNIVRTYCRKRKRIKSEIENFRLAKRRSYSQDFTEENNLNLMLKTMHGGFQNVYTQGIEMLSSISLLLYKCQKQENIVFRPTMFTKSSPGQFAHEIRNVGHAYNEIEGASLDREELGYLHKKRCKSDSPFHGRLPHVHKPKVAEETMSLVPNPELSFLEHIMGYSEEIKIGDIHIVNPINSVSVCSSCKLEVDEKTTIFHTEKETLVQVCITEDAKRIKKEVSVHDSSRCSDHKKNQKVKALYIDRSDTDNTEKTVAVSNNLVSVVITPRTEGHLQSQGNMLNHLSKYSSIPKSDQKDETNDKSKAIDLTMENCQCLLDEVLQQFRRDKDQTWNKQKTKCNCGQTMNTNEKRESSKEHRNNISSISNNHIQQKPFPNFESFIVEEEEGSGGYGTVYKARRKADGVKFAIKCPRTNATRNYVHNELKMLEQLGGKNFVIKYEGSFKCGSADCLVLEHVVHDRPEILKREINIIQLQWYGYCLFKALAGLHKQAIVHRDVKPGNFLYSRNINKGYLIDFNLALDMRRKNGTIDDSKTGHSLHSAHIPIPRTKSLPSAKSRKLMNTKFQEKVKRSAEKVSKSFLPPGNLIVKNDKGHVFTGTSSRNIIKSQGAEGSGITSAKDATSTRMPSEERLREPLPSQGRKELLSLVQEARQCNHKYVKAPISKQKRVAALPALRGDADSKLFYPTPMPLCTNGIAIDGTGSLKTKVDGKHRPEGSCVGTKGFKAPEVLFRSLHQGLKTDIWSAGVTLLYLMIGRTPFTGDTNQNLMEIAKLRGSEDLWEVAKLHNRESLFPVDLLDIKYLPPVELRDWCARNTRRSDFLENIPRSLFDLVDKCLMVNPRQRISAEEALRHEFFSPCHEAVKRQRLKRQRTQSVDSQPVS